LLKNQIPITPSQNPIDHETSTILNPLNEQTRQAKGDLEVLIATGKQMSFIDLDNLSEKDIPYTQICSRIKIIAKSANWVSLPRTNFHVNNFPREIKSTQNIFPAK
jgi:hypothetical protein